jgi:hypothetical protein
MSHKRPASGNGIDLNNEKLDTERVDRESMILMIYDVYVSYYTMRRDGSFVTCDGKPVASPESLAIFFEGNKMLS